MPHEQTLRQPTPEPSQHDEPPIPGPSQASGPHEDPLTCEPEPEVAPTQSTEEPFACPATPASIIIIDNMPLRSLLPRFLPLPPRTQPPPPLDPTMILCRNFRTCKGPSCFLEQSSMIQSTKSCWSICAFST
ncbi:hypothetical protein O181_007956 [Austropuccinia psidii MF-1]|uniref:Uncharacterized protein n=1 Tax=Austropuccinia psidii MF-1 TaxID=1389203 RepID=A0A9Q3BLS4_9BASI|nr:hypothetical protein [Austropuccinia psidii MF-1]